MAVRPDWDDMEAVGVDGAPDAAEWFAVEDEIGPPAALDDDGFADRFTKEIENVTASDWDVDADALWGDDGAFDAGTDPGAAFDFPV